VFTFILMTIFQVNLDWISQFPIGFLPSLVLDKSPWEQVGQVLWAWCPSCHPISSDRALEEMQSTDPTHWPNLILSSSNNRLLMEQPLLAVCRLSKANMLLTSSQFIESDIKRGKGSSIKTIIYCYVFFWDGSLGNITSELLVSWQGTVLDTEDWMLVPWLQHDLHSVP